MVKANLMLGLTAVTAAVKQLFFPHVCAGCAGEHLGNDSQICPACLQALHPTLFSRYANNPVEKKFTGRVPVQTATAQFYFSKSSVLQQLVFNFKYAGNMALGIQLGRSMGHGLQQAERFTGIDLLLPVPLAPRKLRKRGFNQSAVLCNGISEITGWPVVETGVQRLRANTTQTRKDRVQRWENVSGIFGVSNQQLLQNKHVLLVDDVITTGATLEACAQTLLTVKGLQLSIATLCYVPG